MAENGSPPAKRHSMDKAGQKYWNDLWAVGETPHAVDPADTRVLNWVNRQYHQLFLRVFNKSRAVSMRLLEVGCGQSAWLPYFVKEFGFQVVGLDYSPLGCDKAKQILSANGVAGEVVQADLFQPPANMIGKFDVVVSFGVVEHFDDTGSCVTALSQFLKPGGMLITSIPNMVGVVGTIQRVLNRPVYDIHQLIDSTALRRAHERADLEVLECGYFLLTSFGVLNLTGISTTTPIGLLKKVGVGILARVSILMWLIENRIGLFPPNRTTSPYINCVALKRARS